VLSVLFGYLLPAEVLEMAEWRALNLHPAYLPWNRGADPNVWPLIDGSPGGTTLHVMTAGLDAGPIIAQRRVEHRADDTGESFYQRLMVASYDLFTATWPEIEAIDPTPQPPGGSYHRRSDLTDLDLTSEDLPTLNKLRARTFGPYGAEADLDGGRYNIQVSIRPVG
jgi:methionyl-tRNA formyltransferase